MGGEINNELIEASGRYLDYYNGSVDAQEHTRRVLDCYEHAVMLARERALDKLQIPASNVLPFPRQPEPVPDSVA